MATCWSLLPSAVASGLDPAGGMGISLRPCPAGSPSSSEPDGPEFSPDIHGDVRAWARASGGGGSALGCACFARARLREPPGREGLAPKPIDTG